MLVLAVAMAVVPCVMGEVPLDVHGRIQVNRTNA